MGRKSVIILFHTPVSQMRKKRPLESMGNIKRK